MSSISSTYSFLFCQAFPSLPLQTRKQSLSVYEFRQKPKNTDMKTSSNMLWIYNSKTNVIIDLRERETLRAWRPKEVVAKEETKSESLSHSRTLRLSWWMEAATNTVCLCFCFCFCFSCVCFNISLLTEKENVIVLLQLQDDNIFLLLLKIAHNYGYGSSYITRKWVNIQIINKKW